MSSKTDSGDGDKGAPLTKPKVGGGYRQRYHEPMRKKNSAAASPARFTFIGITEDLKVHIYDVGTGSRVDQFTATTKSLASYAGRKCTVPQNI